MLVRILIAASLLVSLAGCVAIGATSGRVSIKDENTTVEAFFTERDRTLIQDYYRRKPLPPGLAKRGKLPPGLAKRDALPPGLAGDRLPHEIESKLSSLPTSYVRLRVGQDIVVMNTKTRVVFDILYNLGR